ncbi:G-D-S-L family lipolytic protein [Nonlabens ulvanivorans]|uniref:G-D-S-L family lipolytic protein n=1 Tax=Nonlabens ulvanivorans TaxID=906888 RepID=UPI002942EDBF|nr:G-D-S-L family lipolytic protein [Nonlabens ulvanivorans]WOI22158.1 G-D-S-L family lipolytic protein [Nonlabens ulvanivorans]
MKKFNLKYIGLFIAAAAVVSCEVEFDNPIDEAGVYTSGEADFSNYVSVGNSLTSGYADGALYLDAQLKSFPAIMAGQMELAGGGEFIQPLVNDNAGGLLAGGVPIPGFGNRFVLAIGPDGSPGPAVYTGEAPTTDITNTVTGKLNNYGVPGAKSFHLGADTYGNIAALPNANPYYIRFASSPSATIIGDAAAANPSFFTLWIGNNDILSFATSGGIGVDQTGNFDPTSYGSNDITDPNVFAGAVSQYVTALTANGAKGALVNIPDVTSIPFFTTVPFAPLSPANPDFAAQIPALNAQFGALNQAFAFLGVPERSITFSTTAASAVVIKDESLTDISAQLTQVLIGGGFPAQQAALFGQQYGQARQATEDDLLVFTSQTVIAQLNSTRFQELVALGLDQATAGQLSVNGITFPLEDQWVLTPEEQTAISTAQTAYNSTLEALAAANDLAFVDARTALSQVANGGVSFNGGVLTSTYATGGAFSLDGVHPTPRGYALTANFIIDAINAKYDANVPKVNIGAYRSIQTSDSVN